MSQSSWLVGGVLPGIERQPRKKLETSPERLLALLHRWRDEAIRAGGNITRIALAFEAGRDGFWLARWLAARGRASRLEKGSRTRRWSEPDSNFWSRCEKSGCSERRHGFGRSSREGPEDAMGGGDGNGNFVASSNDGVP
jgi:hypothetical protein